jgi:hypothetical protein
MQAAQVPLLAGKRLVVLDEIDLDADRARVLGIDFRKPAAVVTKDFRLEDEDAGRLVSMTCMVSVCLERSGCLNAAHNWGMPRGVYNAQLWMGYFKARGERCSSRLLRRYRRRGLAIALGRGVEIFFADPAFAVGDFFRGGNFDALAFFDHADENSAASSRLSIVPVSSQRSRGPSA